MEAQNKFDLPTGSRCTEKHPEDELVNLAFCCILQKIGTSMRLENCSGAAGRRHSPAMEYGRPTSWEYGARKFNQSQNEIFN